MCGIEWTQLLSSGTCGCHGYDLTKGDDYKLVIPEFSYLEFYIGEFSEDVQRQVVEALCSGVIALGDMDQVGSVYYSTALLLQPCSCFVSHPMCCLRPSFLCPALSLPRSGVT